MKNFVKLCVIVSSLVIITSYVLLNQSNDVMLMKHWIELIIIEGFVQEALYLLKNNKIIIKKEDMKKIGIIVFLVLCVTVAAVWAQVKSAKVAVNQNNQQAIIKIDNKDCPMGGDNPRLASLDSLKNRYVVPNINEYKEITFNDMSSLKYNSVTHSSNEAVYMKAYVSEVKFGGSETCNCHTLDKSMFDTHIVLSPNETDLNPIDGIVAEVTPRLRNYVGSTLGDTTTNQIRGKILHHWVIVHGYLFNDEEHKTMSKADGASVKNTHRSTTWEIHPVTIIKICDKP